MILDTGHLFITAPWLAGTILVAVALFLAAFFGFGAEFDRADRGAQLPVRRTRGSRGSPPR